MKTLILTFILNSLSCLIFLNAQELDFTLPSTVCYGEQIAIKDVIKNNFENFEWDFCEGDLLESVSVGTPHQINTIDQAASMRIVEDDGMYFGFIIDRNTNKLIRLEFGDDLSNIPTNQEVVLPAGMALLSPQGIVLIKVLDVWYCFITSTGNNKVFRLDFGSQLTSNPSFVEVDFQNTLGSPIDIEIVRENSNYFLLVLNFGLNNMVTAKLGTSITNNSPSLLLNTLLPGSSNPYGFSFQKYQDGRWRGIAGSFSNSSFQTVEFSNGLEEPAIVTDITALLPSIPNPVKLVLANWGDENVLLVMAYGGSVHRIHFERTSNFSSIESSSIVNPASFGPTLALTLFYEKGVWRALTFPTVSRSLVILYFNKSCSDVNIHYSVNEDPPEISFSIPGVKDISLRAVRDGLTEKITKSILIQDIAAPLVELQTDGVCTDGVVNFSASSDIPIQNYAWFFGDTNESDQLSPTHQYLSSGDYLVRLEVEAANGCNNFTERTIKIYNPPSATFALPTGLICTSNEFTFTNNTVDSFEGNLSFQWLLDDVPVSTDEDLVYTFTSGGDKELTLQASIPGCTSESVQVLTGVGVGPTVDFTAEGSCLNESTQLTNNSQGDIASSAWDFGDGQSSNDTSPFVNYASAGNYTIELQTLGTNGCLSTKSLPHQIFSVPVPNFNTDLPPFSCNGTPTQFNDLTPALTDSNINTWQWDFDDQNASASTQNPQHTYALSGDYNVSLTVTSDQNCVATLNKTITIAQSPTPSITNTAACVETAVVLQETTTTTANAWQWQIGNNFYFTASPSHVFSTPGDYQVSLTLTASNGCVGTATKQINVPVPLVVNFESAFNCVNTSTQFTSLINDESDPVLTYTWTFSEEQRNGSSVNFLYSQPGIQEVQLTASATSGCAYTITKAVNILPEPKADFSFTPLSGPPPLAVTFTNLSVDANSFAWRFNDSNNNTSNLNSPAFTFTEVGEYAVDLTAYNTAGCESTTSKLIAVAFPFLNVTLDNFRIIENTDGSFLLLTNIVNSGNVLVQNPRIEIRLDNSATLQEVVNNSIDPGDAIDYTFATQVSNVNNLSYACVRLLLPNNEALENTEACITFNTSSVLTSPYPNPANNSVTVEWISPADEQVLIAVTDNLGNGIATESISAKQGLNTIVLQTMDWQAGIYYIRLKSASKAHYFRTIIAR
ncbi:PKD domain-containing protein [Chryseotalea sanaruensis]|nr:PKD domain-containing protein [Chryseotalea sanaruensis]